MKIIVAILLALAVPLPAAAGSFGGTLAAPGVVWISDGSHPAVTLGTVVSQQNRTFVPELAVVAAGSDVTFRSDDDVDHSVYSVSRAGPFDLGIYERGPGKDVTFARSGAIDVRCHIHRHMRATVVVVDGPFARVDRAGAPWNIDNVRAGKHVLHTWTLDGGERTQTVTVR